MIDPEKKMPSPNADIGQPLFFTRRFLPFFGTFTLGAFNDNVFRNSLVILITYQSGFSPETASSLSFLAMALLMLPFFPFSAPAGAAADWFSQKKLFRAVKLAELILMLLTFAAFLCRGIAPLMVLLFLMGTQSAFFSPLKYAYIPRMMPGDLVRGNSYVNAGTYLAILFGTVVGNLLIVNKNGTMITGAVLVAAAAAGCVFAFLVPDRAPSVPTPAPDFNPVSGTAKIIKIVFREPVPRRCVIGLSIFWMAGALYLSQLAGFCREIIGAGETLVMAFTLLFSAGVALGSYLCGLFRRRPHLVRSVPWALLLMAIFTADLYFASKCWSRPFPDRLTNLAELMRIPSFWRFAADLVLLAACGGFYSVPLNALLQRSGKPEVLARIIAANNVVNSAAIAIGSGCVILLLNGHWLTLEGIFLFIAAVNAGAALFLRSIRNERLD